MRRGRQRFAQLVRIPIAFAVLAGLGLVGCGTAPEPARPRMSAGRPPRPDALLKTRSKGPVPVITLVRGPVTSRTRGGVR